MKNNHTNLAKKENNLLLFEKDDKEIFILGTIHYSHLINKLKSTIFSDILMMSIIRLVIRRKCWMSIIVATSIGKPIF